MKHPSISFIDALLIQQDATGQKTNPKVVFQIFLFEAMTLKTCFLFLFWAALTWAHDPIFPNTQYDESLPTLKSEVGFDFGHQITMTYEAMRYAQALADASEKVRFQEHGRTFEGRPLAKLFVSSPANIARLEEFQKRYQALADPGKTGADALPGLLDGLPALVLLQESVHGNEISGTDSGLFLAYHLAAAKNNPEVARVLDQAIVMIEISQNPDGRDRFVTYSRQHRAAGGDGDPQAAERREPWPSGRSNHYLFDMNRDWFAMTQPETKAKVKMFLEWFPQVTVDLHEMGSESSFFAANPSPPANPMLSPQMRAAYQDLGQAIAKKFDARGLDYFQGEIFDSFYPGYGESWPSLQGSIGVLFEQASARGLVYRRADGTLLHHRDAVANQALASYAVVTYAADHREKVLRFFYDTRNEPMTQYKEDRQVFLLPGKDPLRMLELGKLLQAQGIVVEQIDALINNLSGKHRLDGETSKHQIPAGSLLVRFNQPAGRLARTLLIDQVDMDDKFLKEERERYHKREFSQIYDITGWSLPFDFGVEAVIASGAGWRGSGKTDLTAPSHLLDLDATLAYFIPYGANTGKVIAELLKANIKVHFTEKPIKFGTHNFGPGSLIVKRAGNRDDLPQKLKQIAQKHQVSVVGTSSGWFDEGPSLGSGNIHAILPFRAAMFWGEPNSTLSAGWLRYTLEQELGFPVTALNTEDVGRFDLSKYQVIFMPSASSGGLSDALGKGGANKVKEWVRAGGVLIALDRSVDWLIDQEMLATAREMKDGMVSKGEEPKGPPKKPENTLEEMLQPQGEFPESVYGALLRVKFDPGHWLAYGMAEEQAVMVNSSRIYRPLRLDAGSNVGMYAPSDRLLMSGFATDATLSQMAEKPFAMTARSGRGLVVGFTEDPNFRGFMKGLQPLIVNALFFGPTQTY